MEINQEVWYLEVPDTTNQALLTVCVFPAPPCNCPMECVGPMPIYPNISITLLLCGNMNVDELEVLDRWTALEHKNQKLQLQVLAEYALQRSEALAQSDFRGYDEQQFHDEYWTEPFFSRLRAPKWKWWQWILVIGGAFVVAWMLSPKVRLMILEMFGRSGGTGGG